MRQWTDEARKKQSELIKNLQPWRKSTGPKTAEGKAKSCMNAYKHGLYGKAVRQMRDYFRQSLQRLRLIRAVLKQPPLKRDYKQLRAAIAQTFGGSLPADVYSQAAPVPLL